MRSEASFFICEKHGGVRPDKIIYSASPSYASAADGGIRYRYCSRCWQEDKRWILVYEWNDALTKEDFGAENKLLREGIK